MKMRKSTIKRRKRMRRVAFRSAIVRPCVEEYKRGGDLKSTYKVAKVSIRKAGGKRKVRLPRIIPIPKRGGFLPFLIPIATALGALGSLTGGVAAVVKTVKDLKNAKEQFQEAQRHNKTMESIALGKGLYIRPYRTGLGLYIGTPDSIKKNFN
jgi:hypothetical protein